MCIFLIEYQPIKPINDILNINAINIPHPQLKIPNYTDIPKGQLKINNNRFRGPLNH